MTLPFVRDLFLELERHPSFQAVATAAKRESLEKLQLSGLGSTARALLTVLLYHATSRTVLVLVDSNKQIESMADSIESFYRLLFSERQTGPLELPGHDILPYDGLAPHPDISEKRAIGLWRLAGEAPAPLVITSLPAALLKLESREFYRTLACHLVRGDEMSMDLVVEELERIGYERHEPVEMVGQYSVRGGILDVYSPENPRPVRIEFFGDEIESLRRFDIETQRSVLTVDDALLLPMAEQAFLPVRPRTSSILDLVKEPLVVYDEKSNVRTAAEKLWARLEAGYDQSLGALGAREGAVPPSAYYWSLEEWAEHSSRFTQVTLEELGLELGQSHHISTQTTTRFQGNMPQCMRELQSQVSQGIRLPT